MTIFKIGMSSTKISMNDDIVKVNCLNPQSHQAVSFTRKNPYKVGRHYAHSTMPLYPINSQRFLNKTFVFLMLCTALVLYSRLCKSILASSPGPTQKLEKGLVTLAKIPIFAVSAVFIWSRGIMFVHYQSLNSWHVKVVDSFQGHLTMGTKQADFS